MLPKQLKQDLKNKRFGKLVAKQVAEVKKAGAYWLCECDCGVLKSIYRQSLLAGDTRSCGCSRLENISKAKQTHRMTGTRLYRIWRGIQARVYNENDKYYSYYGGRGVKCEWDSFENFSSDMLDSYERHKSLLGEKDTTLERIDTNGSYSKTNCKWATRAEQNQNKRDTKLVTFNGQTKKISAWSAVTKISSRVIRERIYYLGWPVEKALSTPLIASKSH